MTPKPAPALKDLAGVLFDKDGTLVDIARTWNPTLHEVMRVQSNGEPDTLARLAQALDFDLENGRLRRTSLFIAGSWPQYGPLWAQALGRANDSALHDETRALLRDAAKRHVVPIGDPGGVARALLTRGLRLGLATNDAELAARDQAYRLGLGESFEFFAGYDSGHGSKPEPGMVLAFAGHIGVVPARVALVGDSNHDLIAARRAGAVSIAVLTGPATAAELAPNADYIIETIADLPSLLERGASD